MKRAEIIKTIFDFLTDCGVTAKKRWKQEEFVKDKVSGESIYIQQIGEVPFGWPAQSFEEKDGKVYEVSAQFFLATLQIDCYVPYNFTNANAVDSTEQARKIKMLLQTESFINHLKSVSKEASILQITPVREVQMQNDSNRWETVSSFDVVISHQQVERVQSAKIDRTEFVKLVL